MSEAHTEFTEGLPAFEVTNWTRVVSEWELDLDKPNPYVAVESRKCTCYILLADPYVASDESQATVKLQLAEEERRDVERGNAQIHKTSPSACLDAGLMIEDLQ